MGEEELAENPNSTSKETKDWKLQCMWVTTGTSLMYNLTGRGGETQGWRQERCQVTGATSPAKDLDP